LIQHPTRIYVISLLAQYPQLSPLEMSRKMRHGLPLVAYHVRICRDLGAIREVETRHRRGAVEHFYEIIPESRLAIREAIVEAREIRDAVEHAFANL